MEYLRTYSLQKYSMISLWVAMRRNGKNMPNIFELDIVISYVIGT